MISNGVIQLKNGTAANWTSANPVLAQGEMGIESDTQRIKVGDGATDWNSLTYFSAVPSVQSALMTMSSDQTTGLTAGNKILFDTIEGNSLITISNNEFILPNGYIYTFTGQIMCAGSNSNAGIGIQMYNTTTGAYFGSFTYTGMTTYTVNRSMGPCFSGIISNISGNNITVNCNIVGQNGITTIFGKNTSYGATFIQCLAVKL
jgi:hypothetical protein